MGNQLYLFFQFNSNKGNESLKKTVAFFFPFFTVLALWIDSVYFSKHYFDGRSLTNFLAIFYFCLFCQYLSVGKPYKKDSGKANRQSVIFAPKKRESRTKKPTVQTSFLFSESQDVSLGVFVSIFYSIKKRMSRSFFLFWVVVGLRDL